MIQSVLKMVLRRQLICKASLNKQMALGNVGKSYVKLHWFTEFSQKIVEETPKVWNWHSGRSRNGQFLCSNFVCCANALVLLDVFPRTGCTCTWHWFCFSSFAVPRKTRHRGMKWIQMISVYLHIYIYLFGASVWLQKELQGSIRFYDTMSCACTSPNSHFPCVAEKYSTLSPLL